MQFTDIAKLKGLPILLFFQQRQKLFEPFYQIAKEQQSNASKFQKNWQGIAFGTQIILGNLLKI
jgi:hypothetical protein